MFGFIACNIERESVGEDRREREYGVAERQDNGH